MERMLMKIGCIAVAAILLPVSSFAQAGGWAADLHGFHEVLDRLYQEMLPLCSKLIGVGRGIAGFAALWYIASRVWGHIARSESIDFYPLFRPFVIGFAIAVFPSVIALINGVMQPTVNGTKNMVAQSDLAIEALIKQKEEAVKNSDLYQVYVGPTGEGDRDQWYQYTHPESDAGADESWMESIGNDIRFALAKAGYNFRNGIKEVIAEVLQLLFAAASLAINTMRTFNLLILAILGPLAFGLAVFDGFGQSLKHWIARYINVFLWLPIANIFGAVIGKIQEQMLQIDISQISENGDSFFSRTDMGYMIFLIIGILGYFSVPSIANQIIWVGGGNALTGKTTGAMMATGAAVGGVAGALTGAAAGQAIKGAENLAKAPYHVYEGYKSGGGKKGPDYMEDKLKGN
ncbi:conjugative transposon protein TraJ [Niabella terrae]